MCVRTKTSYGCGHEYKTTTDCRSSRCPGIERYHYPKNGDCRECKRGGGEITRGREGKGRYARELSRRGQDREREISRGPIAEICDDLEILDIGGGISPWASPSKKEKDWGSPSRRKADRAWLEEHGERNSDIQTIRETMSSVASSDQASTIYSPPRHVKSVHDYEEDQYYDHDDEYDQQRRMETTERNLQAEIRGFQDDYDRRSRRPVNQRQRHDSQESFQSIHSTRSSSRRYKPAPTSYTTYDYYETRDSGYGSYDSRASNGYESAKTEPYMCSPMPHMIKVKAPSTSSHGVYHTGFGVNGGTGVDIVSRTPLYSYSQRRY